jgi:hypothetical protein
MRGPYDEPPPRPGIVPAVLAAAAWEDERMHAVPVDYGKLKIAIEGGSRNGLPHAQNRCSNLTGPALT